MPRRLHVRAPMALNALAGTIAVMLWMPSAAAQDLDRTGRDTGAIRHAVDDSVRALLDAEAPPEGRPTFRASVTVQAPLPTPSPSVPLAPRPRGTLYHEEFLSLVTPDEFRQSAGVPMAQVSTDPGAIFHRVSAAWRARQARRERERVARELEAIRSGVTSPRHE